MAARLRALLLAGPGPPHLRLGDMESEVEAERIWHQYVSWRRQGLVRPFYARKQAPKSSLWLLPTATAPFVVKEYSGARKQVERELAIVDHLARPGHPGLTTYAFVADQGGRTSVVMDWAGEGLREYRARFSDDGCGGSSGGGASSSHAFTESAARHVAFQLTSALSYCHAMGVIHRDIKPDNIGVSHPEQAVRLFDWGEALTLDEAASLPERALARVVGVSGTPLFMAPEVLAYLTGRAGPHGKRYALRDTLTTKLDVWGLGCVIYFLLAGRDMLSADGGWQDLDDVAERALGCSADAGAALPDGVVASAAARDFLSRCLARDPAARAGAKELFGHPWLRGAESHEELRAARDAAAAAAAARAVADVLGPSEVCTCFSGGRGSHGHDAPARRGTAYVRVVADDVDDGAGGSGSDGGSGSGNDGAGCSHGGAPRRSPAPHACCVAPVCELRSPRISTASSAGDEAICEVRLAPSGGSSSSLAAALAAATISAGRRQQQQQQQR